MSKIPYKLVVGSLMYEMVCTWLDITFVLGIVSQHLATLGNADWSTIKTLLQFMFSIGFSGQKTIPSIYTSSFGHVQCDLSFWLVEWLTKWLTIWLINSGPFD
jgi:hypothetical protein